MKKATFIDPKDLQLLEFDENGNIIIPEGFEIYIKEDPETKRQERIAKLEAELSNMAEPSQDELIEFGRSMHHYYLLTDELNYYRSLEK